MKTLVVGDIHGCLDEFKQLISDTNPNAIYSVGDLIDRGPKSMETVDFCIDNDVKVVLGNHELMFIEAISNYFPSKDRFELKFTGWWANGGDRAFRGYTDKKLIEHLEYFKQLPTYRTLQDIYYKDKRVVTSHSMTTHFHAEESILAIKGPSFNDIGNKCTPLVWNRDRKPFKDSPYFNIHGHSPTDWYADLDHEPYFTDYQLNLDTGCAYDAPTRGYLTGVILEDMSIHQVKRRNNGN